MVQTTDVCTSALLKNRATMQGTYENEQCSDVQSESGCKRQHDVYKDRVGEQVIDVD